MSKIRCLVLDVDGTLTDGMLYVNPSTGEEMRAFNVHDGFAIKMFQRVGNTVAICSGKGGGSIEHRAQLLGIEDIIQSSTDKLTDITRLADKLGISLEQVAMMGDDLPDAAIMKACGLGIAPANARDEVKAIADWVTTAVGGAGAVREAIERLMREDGSWDEILAHYDATR